MRAALSFAAVIGGFVLLMAWCALCMTGALLLFGLIEWGMFGGVAIMVAVFGGLGLALWSVSRVARFRKATRRL